MRKVFSQDKTCIRTGFRRAKNLKDLLVQSSMQPGIEPQTDNPDCVKCHSKVCDAYVRSLTISLIYSNIRQSPIQQDRERFGGKRELLASTTLDLRAFRF